jgi:hypothetical protein
MTAMSARRVAALLSVAAYVWLQAGMASAHPASTWYPSKWTNRVVSGVNTDRSVNWKFVANFPSGDGGRDAIRYGAGQWNAQGQSLKFTESRGADYSSLQWGTCSSAYQTDKVGWERIDGGGDIIAQTSKCIFNTDHSVLFNFKMRYDSSESWYKWSSTPVPANRFDLRGVATHEFGHAGGFTPHWDANGPTSLCPGSGPAHHTMCSTLQAGTAAWRSLADHDRHTFGAAY